MDIKNLGKSFIFLVITVLSSLLLLSGCEIGQSGVENRITEVVGLMYSGPNDAQKEILSNMETIVPEEEKAEEYREYQQYLETVFDPADFTEPCFESLAEQMLSATGYAHEDCVENSCQIEAGEITVTLEDENEYSYSVEVTAKKDGMERTTTEFGKVKTDAEGRISEIYADEPNFLDTIIGATWEDGMEIVDIGSPKETIELVATRADSLFETRDLVVRGTYLGDTEKQRFFVANMPVSYGEVKVEEIYKGSCEDMITIQFWGGMSPLSELYREQEEEIFSVSPDDPRIQSVMYRMEDPEFTVDPAEGQEYLIFLYESENEYVVGEIHAMREINEDGEVYNPDTKEYETVSFMDPDSSHYWSEEPEDFTFSLTWGPYEISSYDSETGKLVKTWHATNPEDYVTTYVLSDEELRTVYALIRELHVESYPDTFVPNPQVVADHAMTITLSVRRGGFDESVTAEGVFGDYIAADGPGQKFLDTVKAIIDMLEETEEWRALPDYEHFYE